VVLQVQGGVPGRNGFGVPDPDGLPAGLVPVTDGADNYGVRVFDPVELAVPVGSAGAKFFGVPESSLVAVSTYNMAGTRPTTILSPFSVKAPVLIEELSYQITGFTGGTNLDLLVSVYDADLDWQPVAGTGRLLSTTNHTGVGVTTITGLSATLNEGRYVTELRQVSGVGSFCAVRVFGVDVAGASVMNLAVNPQNGIRLAFTTAAATGTKWADFNQSAAGGGIGHPVLFQWSY
jgi:hypothetical protein